MKLRIKVLVLVVACLGLGAYILYNLDIGLTEKYDSVIQQFNSQLQLQEFFYDKVINIRKQEQILPTEKKKVFNYLKLNTGFVSIPLQTSEHFAQVQNLKIKTCQDIQDLQIQKDNIDINSNGRTQNITKFLSLPGFPGVCIHQDAHVKSVTELGRLYQTGFGVEINQKLSLALFKYSSSLGEAGAHGELGFLQQLGLHNLNQNSNSKLSFSQPDFAGALVHLYFGAIGGDSFSQIVLGFRHSIGLGVPQSHATAAMYYQPLAEKVIELATESNTLPQIERTTLTRNQNWGLRKAQDPAMFQFWQNSADSGQHDAQAMVGRLLNIGVNGIPRNHKSAIRYLRKAAKTGKASALSALGHMYAGGIELPQDFQKAQQHFAKAAMRNCPGAYFGLGYLHMNGLGVTKNLKSAVQHFQNTIDAFNQAEQENNQEFILDEPAMAGAKYYLGQFYLHGLGGLPQNSQEALQRFIYSANMGHLLGKYNAAMLMLQKSRTHQNSLKKGSMFLKEIVQKGPMFGIISNAYDSYKDEKYAASLIQYLKAGAMGSEIAISNAAFIIEKEKRSFGDEAAYVELLCYQQAAEQGNTHALLQIGDLYWKGRGVQQDRQKAAIIYAEASNRNINKIKLEEPSAQAYFNLGIVHQFGQGLPKDLHLAKRFYDLAYETNKNAYLAVRLAIYLLSIQKFLEDKKSTLPLIVQELINWLFQLSSQEMDQQGQFSQYQNVSSSNENIQYIQNSIKGSQRIQINQDITIDTSWFTAIENFLIIGLIVILIYVVRQIQLTRNQFNNLVSIQRNEQQQLPAREAQQT